MGSAGEGQSAATDTQSHDGAEHCNTEAACGRSARAWLQAALSSRTPCMPRGLSVLYSVVATSHVWLPST